MSSRPSRVLARRRPLAAFAVVVAMLTTLATAPVNGASSGTVVTANIPSATSITPTCGTGTSRASFGTVLPGATAMTATDCHVAFDSSNSTATLSVYQQDGSGAAMWGRPPGDLETTFGVGGRAVDWRLGWWSHNMRRLADGSFLLVGGGNSNWAAGGGDAGCNPGADVWISVAKLQPNGAYDLTWDGDGRNCIDPTASDEYVHSIDVQPDGKLLVGAYSNSAGQNWRIVRVGLTGARDNSCGTLGVATLDMGANEDHPHVLATADGTSIYVVGQTDLGGDGQIAIAKLQASDCSLDLTWGTGGKQYVDPSAFGYDDVRGAELQPDGSIVVVGQTPGAARDVLVARIKPDGTLDTTGFGVGGFRSFPVSTGQDDVAHDVDIASDGSIYVSGIQGTGAANEDGFIAKLTSAGALDGAFGAGGVVKVSVDAAQTDSLMGVEATVDGSVTAVGGVTEASGDRDSVMVRVDSTTGAWDNSLDGDGRLYFSQHATISDELSDIAVGPDGALYTGGPGDNGGSIGFMVTRFKTTPITDYNDAGNNDWQTPSAEAFGVCLSAHAVATIDWAELAGCSQAADGAHWRAIPATAGASAVVAHTTVVGQAGVSVDLRFGFRPLASRRAGTYVAPITFDVVAP